MSRTQLNSSREFSSFLTVVNFHVTRCFIIVSIESNKTAKREGKNTRQSSSRERLHDINDCQRAEKNFLLIIVWANRVENMFFIFIANAIERWKLAVRERISTSFRSRFHWMKGKKVEGIFQVINIRPQQAKHARVELQHQHSSWMGRERKVGKGWRWKISALPPSERRK